MSYRMHLRDAEFCIPAEKTHKAWLAIHDLMYDDSVTLFGYEAGTGDRFAWMNGKEATSWESLDEAMAGWRFPIEYDAEDNVIDISFTGEKAGDEKQMFEAIAPFVETESFVEFQGADGYVWRYLFTEDGLEEQEAETSYSS